MLKDFNAVKISIASPQDIINWSFGEVTKAETINYRTYKPEPQGLMAEEIFGPTKDYECYCGKYKKVRYKGIVCDRCGVEVTHKRVRRERMAHIKLAAPVAHVWFANGVPNRLALILDIPQKKLETVIYYARYVVTDVNAEEQKQVSEQIETLKSKEQEELAKESEGKVNEIKEQFEAEREAIRKEIKDKKKVELQIERINNKQKIEEARIKSAFKQREDSLDKKFDELSTLVESMKSGSTLSEEEYSLLDEYNFTFFDAGMGAEAIKILLEKLNLDAVIEENEEILKTSKSQLKKSRVIQRLRILKGIKKSGVNPAWIILEVLPVTPPDLRPIIQLPGGRFATNDLNDLYRRVINRNNRLRRLVSLGAPEIILRNEKRMLQESVDALLDNNHKPGNPAMNNRGMPFKSLSDMLRGKQGRFRQNLLGKRVDYSGRAVIVAGPELTFDQCGLPKNVALELFKPFVIRELISRGSAANPTRAKMIYEEKSDEVWDILEEVSKNRPVLLNRAPTLHRQSILAFYPVLIEGNAIRLHPMTCTGFNADFDGDQMAVHLPLSEKAVEEVKARMFAKDNMLWLRDGTPITNVAKDMAMGIYFLTLMKGSENDIARFYASDERAIADYNVEAIKFSEPIKVLVDGKIVVTTVGRLLFNRVLPDGFRFINREIGKSDVGKLASEIFRDYGNEQAVKTLDGIKELGFVFAKNLGFSVSMGDFNFGNEEILETGISNYRQKEDELMRDYYDGMITEKELQWLKQKEWEQRSEEIQESVWALAKSSNKTQNLIDLDNSGATPVSAWVKKISGVRGYVSDMYGNIVNLPLTGNFEKGLDNFQYFVAAKAVRKSMTDVALRTSDSGYLTRRLVDVAQDIIIDHEDCGSTQGALIKRSDPREQAFHERIRGRYLAKNVVDPKTGEVIAKEGEVITIKLAEQIEAIEGVTEVELRSPLTCKITHGMCQKCYGYDNGTGKLIDIGEAVGVIAAQALGEPTTQLTLKSKSDARAGKSDVTQGLPRVEELFESRTPKALALLADTDGKVSILEDKKSFTIRITTKKKSKTAIKLAKTDTLVVKNGEEIKKGDTILVKKDKTEIKAEHGGLVQVGENGEVHIIFDKRVEIDKPVNSANDILVEDGQMVEKGQQLTSGSIDPKELAKLRNMLEAQEYIVGGIQEVYGIQGLKIDDKHLEIIVRQMSRFGLINHSGDSTKFLPGDYADVLEIEAENVDLKEKGKEGIKFERVLLGVTNSSIRTESFLSAASFEQQVRVLTDASLIGKVDHLRGLKENVIIGRPVPLGKVLKRRLGLLEEELVAEKSQDVTEIENKLGAESLN